MISKEAFLISDIPHADDLKTKVLSYRMQEKTLEKWLRIRFAEILPLIMKRSGIDAWVVACNEYNEDPVLRSLTPPAMFTARRLTVLLFILQDNGEVKKMCLTRPNVGLDDFYEAVWLNQKDSLWCEDPAKAETQFECLARLLKEYQVKKIGLNISKDYAFADGLSKTLYDEMTACFDKELMDKIVSAEDLCVGWLETRSDVEMEAYNGIMQIAHAIIAEAFSSRVIIPGVTTNHDVKYFMLQKVIDLGLQPWFDFEVSIIRKGVGSFEHEEVIRQGDMLHCDFGLRYLGLCTDTQENAYVLKNNETAAPDYLQKILRDVNRFQEIAVGQFKEGSNGNIILEKALKQAKEEGLNASLYTHPIGYHGHAAGPTIGLWDKQQGVDNYTGSYPLFNNTAYSLELNCAFELKEWDNTRFTLGLETDILFKDGEVYYLAGRQEEFHLIK